jgi:hypothetical protein
VGSQGALCWFVPSHIEKEKRQFEPMVDVITQIGHQVK